MNNVLEVFQKERTKLLSEMFDGVREDGIYPTTEFYEKLDGLFLGLCKQHAIEFGATFAYYKANPTTKMDIPSVVFESAEHEYDRLTKY